MSKATGRSTPFKLSFKPVFCSTNIGADILWTPRIDANLSWKVSRMKTIAASVSRTANVGR